MSIAALNWAWTQECPSASAKLVLLALADKANEDGECWPGMDTVAAMAGVSQRQVSTHLARLEEAGLIMRRRRRSRFGHLGRYVFHLAIKSSGRKLPVDQEKPASGGPSGSELPVDQRKLTSGSGLPVGHATTGRKLPVKEHPPSTNTSTSDFSEPVRELTRQFARAVKANGFKVPGKDTKANTSWLTAMDRLLRIDKRDPDEVAEIIDWSTSHYFWRANIQSPAKFREQYPRLVLQREADRQSRRPADQNAATGGLVE